MHDDDIPPEGWAWAGDWSTEPIPDVDAHDGLLVDEGWPHHGEARRQSLVEPGEIVWECAGGVFDPGLFCGLDEIGDGIHRWRPLRRSGEDGELGALRAIVDEVQQALTGNLKPVNATTWEGRCVGLACGLVSRHAGGSGRLLATEVIKAEAAGWPRPDGEGGES